MFIYLFFFNQLLEILPWSSYFKAFQLLPSIPFPTPTLCVGQLKSSVLDLLLLSLLFLRQWLHLLSWYKLFLSPMTPKATFSAQILPPSLRLQYPKVSQSSGSTIYKLIPKIFSPYSWAQLRHFPAFLRLGLVMWIRSSQHRVCECDI